jgi:hypothetical protein
MVYDTPVRCNTNKLIDIIRHSKQLEVLTNRSESNEADAIGEKST